jgi:predicted nuclease of restriction endonuclease-like RecB superfamily
MISLRFDRRTRCVRAMRAYAHPRFTDADPGFKVRATHEWAYVPVDSDMERKALGALLWVAKKGASAGIQISIEKPLFDITPIGADRSCRPDFLVHYGGKTLVIETMGSADPEYLEQKSRTHPTMAMLGKLILDNRATGDADKANKILIRQVIEGLRELGAPWPAAT